MPMMCWLASAQVQPVFRIQIAVVHNIYLYVKAYIQFLPKIQSFTITTSTFFNLPQNEEVLVLTEWFFFYYGITSPTIECCLMVAINFIDINLALVKYIPTHIRIVLLPIH